MSCITYYIIYVVSRVRYYIYIYIYYTLDIIHDILDVIYHRYYVFYITDHI